MNEYYSSDGASEGESTVGQLPDLALDPFDNDNLDDDIEEITGHKLNLRKKKKTPYLQVRWTTGMTTWEPLRLVKKDVPVMAARYIITHKLGKYFHKDWAKRAVNRAAKVISKMRRAAGCSQSEMFGVQIPKTVEAALRMDQENGDNLWQEAIKKEMDALQELDTFKICPSSHKFKNADGWQYAPLRMIFEVKRDLRRKARLVIGGHVTDATGYDTYASTIRTENVRLLVYLIVRGPLSVLVVDIGNAYLNALTPEKIFTRCGPEFGNDAGKTAVIYKALYGLKTSANAWFHELGKHLEVIGFRQSRIDAAFWYRKPKNGGGYDYIASHVDDLLIAAKDAEGILKFLKSRFTIKGGDLPSDYLGLTMKVTNDGQGWGLHTKPYLDQCLESVKSITGQARLSKQSTPALATWHPELYDDTLTHHQKRYMTTAL